MKMQQLEHESFAFGDNSCLVLQVEGDSAQDCLLALLKVTEDLAELFEEHESIEEDEPWFGWAFALSDGRLLHEAELFPSAAKDETLRPSIEEYVLRVTRFFEETNAEPGFYVHEEEEAGSKAIESLLAQDLEHYFALYLRYLRAIDLDHTVEQVSVIHRLAPSLTEEQRAQLRELLPMAF